MTFDKVLLLRINLAEIKNTVDLTDSKDTVSEKNRGDNFGKFAAMKEKKLLDSEILSIDLINNMHCRVALCLLCSI